MLEFCLDFTENDSLLQDKAFGRITSKATTDKSEVIIISSARIIHGRDLDSEKYRLYWSRNVQGYVNIASGAKIIALNVSLQDFFTEVYQCLGCARHQKPSLSYCYPVRAL